MKSLETFKTKNANLASIYGGKTRKTQNTGCSSTDGYDDGYYDADGDGIYDSGEKQYLELE